MDNLFTTMDSFKAAVNPDAVYYFASPYSHALPIVKETRYQMVIEAASVLYNHGYSVLEPIGASHPSAIRHRLPTGYEYWQKRDRMMIKQSHGVIVLALPGFTESVGVQDEIAYATELGLPVYYIAPAAVFGVEFLDEFRAAFEYPPAYALSNDDVVTVQSGEPQ